jgi:hypothetical protein
MTGAPETNIFLSRVIFPLFQHNHFLFFFFVCFFVIWFRTFVFVAFELNTDHVQRMGLIA